MGCLFSKCSSRKKLIKVPNAHMAPKQILRQHQSPVIKKKHAIELILPQLREEERRTQERNLIRQKIALEQTLHKINSALLKI